MSVDAVVIGGGPAGTAAAIRLARSGRRVSLYEKEHFPRQKLCGGFLSPEGLADLEDLHVLDALRRTGVISLHRTVIASRHGTIIESSLPAEALSVSRDTLDQLLLEEARWAGVDVHEGVDGTPLIDKHPITVIATGRMGHPRKNEPLTPWYASPTTPYFGMQALFEGVEGVTDQVELDLIKSGYVGLARQNQGINICALTTQETIKQRGPDLDNVMASFMGENPILQTHLKDAKRVGEWMAVGPVYMGIRRLANENTFYVGDAACVVDPFAGEGMSIGLYSSQLLMSALDQNRVPAAKAYETLWKKAFVPSLRWNAAMRMLYSLSVFREPSLHVLGWYPQGMNWLTELTRYRRLESL